MASCRILACIAFTALLVKTDIGLENGALARDASNEGKRREEVASYGTKRILEHSASDKWADVAAKLKPLGVAMQADIMSGNWQAAEQKFLILKDRWHGEGLKPLNLKRLHGEILIALGRPQEALEELSSEEKPLKSVSALTRNLALAQLGSLVPVEAKKTLSLACSKYSLKVDATVTDGLDDEPIAAIRVARALEAWFEANTVVCEREAKEALRYAPGQPLASYLMAHCLYLRKEEEEARAYLPDAAKLSGPWGEEARAILGIFPEQTSIEID